MASPNLSKDQRTKLLAASRVFINVAGTEFWIKTTKSEIKELSKYVASFQCLEFDEHSDDLYVGVIQPPTNMCLS